MSMHPVKNRLRALRDREEGSISVEYAFVMVICVMLAGVLLAIVTSDQMRAHLTSLVMRSIG